MYSILTYEEVGLCNSVQTVRVAVVEYLWKQWGYCCMQLRHCPRENVYMYMCGIVMHGSYVLNGSFNTCM